MPDNVSINMHKVLSDTFVNLIMKFNGKIDEAKFRSEFIVSAADALAAQVIDNGYVTASEICDAIFEIRSISDMKS